jgi:hypothetical protein
MQGNFSHDGYFNIYAGISHDKIKDAICGIKDELDALAKNGVTVEELESSREQLKAGYIFGQENVAGRMFLVGSRLGVAMRRALDADGFNLHLSDGTVAGQVVMHAHLHIVPRWTDDNFHWNWRQLQYESDEQRDKMAAKIQAFFQLRKDDSEKADAEE